MTYKRFCSSQQVTYAVLLHAHSHRSPSALHMDRRPPGTPACQPVPQTPAYSHASAIDPPPLPHPDFTGLFKPQDPSLMT